MNGLAIARHQRHAAFALRHQHRLAIGQLHDLLRAVADALVGVGVAAGRLGKFLAVGLQEGRAAIDREIGALGIDDHPLAELFAPRRSRGGSPAPSARPWRSRTAARCRRAATAAAPRRSASARCRRKPAPSIPSRRAACGSKNAPRRSAPCAWSAGPDRTPARFRSCLPAPVPPSAWRPRRPRRPGPRTGSARRARRCCARRCRRRRYRSRCAARQSPPPALPAKSATPRHRRIRRA